MNGPFNSLCSTTQRKAMHDLVIIHISPTHATFLEEKVIHKPKSQNSPSSCIMNTYNTYEYQTSTKTSCVYRTMLVMSVVWCQLVLLLTTHITKHIYLPTAKFIHTATAKALNHRLFAQISHLKFM
jgi:hypothetical protein